MNRKTICIILTVVAIAAAVAAYLLLPDTVVSKIDFKGNPTQTMSKTVGTVIPCVISVIGAAMYGFGKAADAKKSLTLYAIGIIVMIVLVIMN